VDLMIRVVVLLAFVALFGAILIWRSAQSTETARPIEVDSSEGFSDLRLPVSSYRCDSKGGCTIESRGVYEGRTVTVRILIASGMRENKSDELTGKGSLFAQKGGVSLQFDRGSGRDFVLLLSSIYKIPVRDPSPPSVLSMTAVPLDGDPQSIRSAPLRFKVFHHDDDPDASDYFELYVDPDLPRRIVNINEKDVGYREGILRALGATIN
jgi:hypothetical protein